MPRSALWLLACFVLALLFVFLVAAAIFPPSMFVGLAK